MNRFVRSPSTADDQCTIRKLFTHMHSYMVFYPAVHCFRGLYGQQFISDLHIVVCICLYSILVNAISLSAPPFVRLRDPQ